MNLTNTLPIHPLDAVLAQLDPDDKGKQGERLFQWYLQNSPEYDELVHVWLWSEWPYQSPTGEPWRWKEQEAGIDLVALHRDGSLWAIQVKTYAQTTTVSMHGISQFLAESARKKGDGTSLFSYRLLIMTTDLLSSHAQDIAVGSLIGVGIVDYAALKAAQVSWPTSLSDLSASSLPPKTPLPHQAGAISDVVGGLTSGIARGQYISACSTGKTLTSLWINEKLGANRTLFLVPSIPLLGQTLAEWKANATVKFRALPVCSDETVADTTALGFPVTTSHEEIAQFLQQDSDTPLVVFSTYHSSPEIARAMKLGNIPEFDLIFADECHRTAGAKSSDFATALDNDMIPAKWRLFMTATPKFLDEPERTPEQEDWEFASMDNIDLYGPVLHNLPYSVAKTIPHPDGGTLVVPFKVVMYATDEEYFKWVIDGECVTYDGKEITDARSLYQHVGLIKAMDELDLCSGITYHSRINRAKDFAADLREVYKWMPAEQRFTGQLLTDQVSGEDSARKKVSKLSILAGATTEQRVVISNPRALTEGINVPSIGFVSFIDPKSSTIDIVQATGRATRRASGKEVAYVIVPVPALFGANAEESFAKSAYQTVGEVLRALGTYDEELAERITFYRKNIGKQRKPQRKPAAPAEVLPSSIGEDFIEALMVRVVELASASFEEWFGVLEEYKEEFGHANPPQVVGDKGPTFLYHGYAIGKWANSIRYKKKPLSPEQIQRLDEIGFFWTPRDSVWKKALEQWKINPRGKFEESWARRQRKAKETGKLADNYVNILNNTEGWSFDPHGDSVKASIAAIKEHVLRHGCLPKEGDDLYATVISYRYRGNRTKNGQKGGCKPEYLPLLEEIPGWTWSVSSDRFEKNLEEAKGFFQLHGRFPQWDEGGLNNQHSDKLYTWLANLRLGIITVDAERKAQLDRELPGWDAPAA